MKLGRILLTLSFCLISVICLNAVAIAATTAVMVGNRIIISGDAVADDGDFDVFANLKNAAGVSKGWSAGSNRVKIICWCWSGADIAIGDVCTLETADSQPIGNDLIAVVADQTQCHARIDAVVDRIYVDQMSHGTIIIYLEP